MIATTSTATESSATILQVAVPSPLRRSFDYLAPSELLAGENVLPGCRVRVPFGRRSVVGLVLAVVDCSDVPLARLRPVEAVLDRQPVIPPELLELLIWTAAYYHHPVGEVCVTALPAALRQGAEAALQQAEAYQLTDAGRRLEADSLTRAPRQAALLGWLQRQGGPVDAGQMALANFGQWRPVMRRLQEAGWVQTMRRPLLPQQGLGDELPPVLGPDQQQAVTAVSAGLGRFGCFLLDGVTGSGKTEVYLQLIARVLAQARQVLLLVPEIGLAPQLLERLRARFAVPVAVLHSGLSDAERLNAWLAVAGGQVPLVIGTRSAVFVPLARPGLIIVDEEHDPSLKQQDGLRYSARDLAVKRAGQLQVPVLLGSATPSLESLANAAAGRYRRLVLPERAGAASAPRLHLLDIRHQPLAGGISAPLHALMERHLAAGGQVLLFLNRRGYAPVVLCHDCGWVAGCQRCDAHYTWHAGRGRMHCHHCASERPLPARCPECGGEQMIPVGHGTERVEQVLMERYPQVGLVRIDRDATRRKGSLEEGLARVHDGSAQILIGTQMLAKGHHFPEVTLVGILDADQGLFSADFRAGERMAQLILQVAGRAGRAGRPGEVLIQTHHPDHPLLQLLIAQGYGAFARAALEERAAAALPPYSHLALLRAEAPAATAAMAFLEWARQRAADASVEGVQLLGPVPAPMERRAGRYRAQLLLQAQRRVDLHRLLGRWLALLEGAKESRRVRWSLDVDPAEMF